MAGTARWTREAGRRALVTGATGYLGTALVRRLCGEGVEVCALARAGSDVSRLPAAARVVRLAEGAHGWPELRELTARLRPDVAFHLAAAIKTTPAEGPDPLIEANVALGTRLCHALSLAGGGALVDAGSYWEYGCDGSYEPLTLYAAAKRALRDVVEHYCLSGGLRAVTLVLFDIYGPGDWRGKFLPALLSAMARGEALPATGGRQQVDMVHVDDAVEGLLTAGGRALAMPRPGHEVFALDGGVRLTLRRLAETLAMVARRPSPVRWGERDYPPHQIFEPVRGVPRLPDWSPSVPLEQGLAGLAAEINTEQKANDNTSGDRPASTMDASPSSKG